jgi:hypothetical protein
VHRLNVFNVQKRRRQMKVRALPLMALALLALPMSVPRLAASPPDNEADLKSLMADYKKAETAFFEPLNKAKTDAEREKVQLDFMKHPAKEYIPKFQALAKQAQGTDASAKALVQVLTLSQRGNDQQAGKQALDDLLAGYIKSPQMVQVIDYVSSSGYFLGEQKMVSTLQRLIDQSPDRKVKAAASFALGNAYMSPYSGIPANPAKAKRLLQAVQREYADTPYAKQAAAALFEVENLSIGRRAPDIAGTDQNGKTFKLSDYRGKVVVLDFWGYW